MSALTKAERDQLTDWDFGDPINRTYVLLDDADVTKAVFRSNILNEPARTQIRRRIVDVALKKGLRIPPSLAIEEIRREVGDYNARQGDSTSAAGANTLRFTVRNEEDLTAACSQARERLQGENMSAQFQSRHDTPQGQSALQEIHNIAARHGAVCKKPANLSAGEFVSKHESSKLQEAHDLAVSGGARCNEQGSPFFSSSQPDQPQSEADIRERARQRGRDHAERRNAQMKGEARKAELSQAEPTDDPRERARAAARRHIEKRNRVIEKQKEDIAEGRNPFHWRQR